MNQMCSETFIHNSVSHRYYQPCLGFPATPQQLTEPIMKVKYSIFWTNNSRKQYCHNTSNETDRKTIRL